MNKFKRFITPVTAAFMLLCMPLLVHAEDNSVLTYPGEGNFTCNNAAPNKLVESMGGSASDGSGIVYGNENQNDPDNTGESAYYEVDLSTNAFRFYGSTTPIDFVALKASNGVLIFFLPSGGLFENSDMVVPDDLGNNQEISSFSLCYGLGNEPEPEPPVNLPPVLALIGDKDVADGDDLMFTVTASDDDLPTPPLLTITNSTLPVGATFTDNGDGSGYFEWLGATPAGSTNVTFTVSDGALIGTETITITVNEIPPEPLATPTCGLDVDKLDDTGIACPEPDYKTDELGNYVLDEDGNRIIINPSVVCQWELGEELYGFADGSDVCCICNGDALVKCDPDLPAGSLPNAAGEYSCNLTQAAKAELDLPAGEVTSIIEFNNDPYYCYTSGGRRICYCYGSLCPTR